MSPIPHAEAPNQRLATNRPVQFGRVDLWHSSCILAVGGRSTTESSGKETGREALSLKAKVTAACLVGIIVVAGFGAWLFYQSHSEDPSVPTLELEREPGTELTFVVRNANPQNGVPWGLVFIKLEATPTDPGASYTYEYWEWHPSTDLLTGQNGESAIQSINSSISTPPHMIICNLTDNAGNGYVNNGDAFALSIVGNEVAVQGVPLKISVYYGGTPMGTMHFQID